MMDKNKQKSFNKSTRSKRRRKKSSWTPPSDFFEAGGGVAELVDSEPKSSHDDFNLVTGRYEECSDQNTLPIQEFDGAYKVTQPLQGLVNASSATQDHNHTNRGHTLFHRYNNGLEGHELSSAHESRSYSSSSSKKKYCPIPPFSLILLLLIGAFTLCGTKLGMIARQNFWKHLLQPQQSLYTNADTDTDTHTHTYSNTHTSTYGDKKTKEYLRKGVTDLQGYAPHNAAAESQSPVSLFTNKIDASKSVDILAAPLRPFTIPKLSGFKDVWDKPDGELDVPIFWHIPKAGGSTVKDIVGSCHGVVLVNENGILDGHDNDEQLKITTITDQGQTKFVNVDTTTISGINRAKSMGLGNSGLAGLIITPFVQNIEELFPTPATSDSYRGRLFATFRHPIDRTISLFKYLQYAEWEPTYRPEFKFWSLENFAYSDQIENNWMTRYLSNEFEAELSSVHLQIAMDVLRRKFLVGLMDDLETSVERFEAYFGWKFTINPTEQETCRESLFTIGTNTNRHTNIEVPKEGTALYTLIANQNVFDMELYKYAVTLFHEQTEFFQDLPKNYRLIGAKCSKCEELELETMRYT